jgi:serine/threonine protein kinase
VDLRRTLQARLDAIGLDPTGAACADTIRVAPAGAGPGLFPTLRSAREGEVSVRELPKISVELRGTLSGPHDDVRAGPPSTREPDLEVLRLLGEGGMGRVFLARQHSLDRDVAIKTVRDTAAELERDALLTEGAVTGHLEHPGVVPVHALGVDEDGRPVLVMKHVEGAPWNELLADPEHPAWSYLGGGARDRLDGNVAILMQVCSAVEFAHSRGILHRDIKPQNVLVGRYGEVYLADWGLALRLDAGGVAQPLCGTPSYMAPEMVTGGPVSARTDVYLLGATLHQILTGSPRHLGVSVREALLSAAESTPVDYPRGVPADLARLANVATSADPAVRPSTALALRDALADHVRHRSSVALSESASDLLSRLERMLADTEKRAHASWQREIDMLGAECGFAFEQALREWPENPAAVAGAAKLDGLLGSRRSRAAELERLARELDPSVGSVPRALALAGLVLVGVGLSVSGFLVDGRAVTTRSLLYQSLGPLAATVVGALALRRHLLRTTLNRRLTLSIVLVTTVLTADRLLALQLGLSGPQVLAFDCLAVAALLTLGAVVFFRWLGYSAALALAASVVAALWPERAMAAFSASTGVGLLVGLYFASRIARAG